MLRILDSVFDVAAADWNSLDLNGNPFVRHEFLSSLEQSGCATPVTGWQPKHLFLRDVHDRPLGAAPVYLKQHSWGEFVFDFSWANAYARLGLPYYPKLVCAVPFTPATGPRLLVAPHADVDAVRRQLLDGLQQLAMSTQSSSAHLLFCLPAEQDLCSGGQFLSRQDCQFHWHNRDYADFAAFIATFRADKRKKLLRERRRVQEAGITFEARNGAAMDDTNWDRAYQLSAATFERHGHDHYLTADFFKRVAKRMPETVVVIRALRQRHVVAVAICFRGSDTLYGRYWGADADYHSLHFETCYLQGIEYCIQHGLRHFEPGTQGEHKIARGFEPTFTKSSHWIADSRLRAAIDVHLSRERHAVDQYAEAVREHLPFHRLAP